MMLKSTFGWMLGRHYLRYPRLTAQVCSYLPGSWFYHRIANPGGRCSGSRRNSLGMVVHSGG
jgi:hypothetical protein